MAAIGPMLLQGATGAPDQGLPTPTAVPQSNPTRPTSNIAGKWSDWISRPENRAGMMQAGLALLQPVSVGQTQAGHIARGIGTGFEARDRNVKGRHERDLELRKAANEERRTDIDALEADNQTKGLTANQRFVRWIEFVNSRAEAMASSELFRGDSGEIFSPEEMRQRIMNDPQLQGQLWQEFLQTEQSILGQPMPGGASSGTPGGTPAPEGTVVQLQDGTTMIKQGGQWVAQ